MRARDFFDCDGAEIDPDKDLFAEGYLDSLGIVQLVAWIEKRCGVRVPPRDIVPANFRSLAAIDSYLARAGQD